MYSLIYSTFFSKDFLNDQPPDNCGFDPLTGEDRFCCSGSDLINVSPQAPQFPRPGSRIPRPCIDHTTHCSRWAKKYPDSCLPGNPGYEFMREACQQSCERCGSKVQIGPTKTTLLLNESY